MTVTARPSRPRRRFVDLAHGQVHYWECEPRQEPDGPPLVMLHASPVSGRSLLALAGALATRRRVFAVDLPGNGDSDPLGPSEPTVEQFAPALADVVERLAPGPVDLYGTHTGASVALEMALARPRRCHRLVIDGIALFDVAERDTLLAEQAPAVAPDLAGCHVLWAWQFVRDSYLFWPWFQRTDEHRRALGLPAPEILHARFVEVVKALGTYRESYRASIGYPHEARLRGLVDVATLFISTPADVLRTATETAASLVEGSEFVEVDEDAGPDRPGKVAVIDAWLGRDGAETAGRARGER